MRSPIYLFAALAAAGIAYYLASSPASGPTAAPGAASAATAEVTPARSQVLADSGTLTLRVDDMHCEYGCFPKVKKTLESFDQVVAVELDQQAEEGALDNPQVLVTYEPGFDLSAAQNALAKSGFKKSAVIP